MKQVVLINADIDKTPITRALINAYRAGADRANAALKEITIADLKFNPNKPLLNKLTEGQPDLAEVIATIRWSHHIVVFCPVYKSSINFKIKGFFDRIFLPDQVFIIRNPAFSNDFSGRSARIVSILDEAAWQDWQINQRTTYLPIKRTILEKCRIKPVQTNTIGHLHSLQNPYAQKWLNKLESFGEKLI
ncbi:NAD(P)H-dependent oxidoreductase [Mucilaginibacter sp. PAMB04274]|uniref:NAD(P)H-dependent oxidoreductase n=1 Tax=Mucilaginibacter sp. PAMB04274 TaxID=3138568 RepID=UPI0031F5F6FD